MVEHLWQWYCDLAERAPASGMGPALITHEQIFAWCRLRRMRLTQWELDCLGLLDACRLSELAERERSERKSPKRSSS